MWQHLCAVSTVHRALRAKAARPIRNTVGQAFLAHKAVVLQMEVMVPTRVRVFDKSNNPFEEPACHK